MCRSRARPDPELKGRGQTSGREVTARLAPKTARRYRRRPKRHPARSCAHRRSAARAPRRESAGGRRRSRGRELDRRVDVTGEPLPVAKRSATGRRRDDQHRAPGSCRRSGWVRRRCSRRSSRWSRRRRFPRTMQRLATLSPVVLYCGDRGSRFTFFVGGSSGRSRVGVRNAECAVGVIIACPARWGGDADVDHGRHRQGATLGFYFAMPQRSSRSGR